MAVTGLAIPVIAQTQSSTTTFVQSSAVIGSKVKDSGGEEVGVIKDVVLDRGTGCLAYVVLSAGKGGTLTTETKTVAAPWSVFSAGSEPKTYVTRIERERIYSAPVWEASRSEEYTRTEYINNVYSYYGVAVPRFGAEISAGVTNSTTTGVSSSSTSLSSSTGANSPSSGTTPRMTAGSTPMSSPRSSPTSSSTAHPVSSPLGTPERSAAPRMTAPASSPKMPSSTRGSTRDMSTPSGHEKKSTEEQPRKHDRENTKAEPASEKDDSSSQSQSQSSEPKKKHGSEHSQPETASTPKED